jgi:O-antigen ligase
VTWIKVTRTFVACCIFVFPCLALVVNKGYNMSAIGLMLAAICAMPFFKKQGELKYSLALKLTMCAFICYTLFFTISIYFDGGELKEVDRSSRTIFGIIILLLLLRFPPSLKLLFNSVACGILVALLSAVYDVYVLHIPRAFSVYMNPIEGGNVIMALASISFCAFAYYLSIGQRACSILFFVTGCLGLFGAILSGTRGAWISFPVVVVMLFTLYSHLFSKKSVIYFVLGCFLLIGSLVMSSNTVTERIGQAANNIEAYQAGDSHTSVGLRFEMWNSALRSIEQSPIYGLGWHGLQEDRAEQFKNKEISAMVYNFTHAHNQYLENAARVGIIGLVSLLAIFISPLYLFYQYLSSADAKKKALAASGIAVVIVFSFGCLTQALFNTQFALLFYVLVIVFFISAIEGKDNDVLKN